MTSYNHFTEIDRKNRAIRSFEEFTTKVREVLLDKKHLYSSLISPLGPVTIDTLYKPDGSLNEDIDIEPYDYENDGPSELVNANDYNQYVYCNSKIFFGRNTQLPAGIKMGTIRAFASKNNNLELRNRRLKFLGLSAANIKGTPSRYLMFVSNKRSELSNGFSYQYKIYTIIDLGYKLYNGLILDNSAASDLARLSAISQFFVRTEYGFAVNMESPEDLSNINELSQVFHTEGDDDATKDAWAKLRYDIKISNISTEKGIRKLLEQDIDNIDEIARSVSDWALIQSRIAAYDSLAGNSLDKDYFITCYGDGCDEIDNKKTLIPVLDKDTIMSEFEKDSSNGFFLCLDNNGICKDSMKDNPPTTTSSVNGISIFDSVTVNYAVPIDYTKVGGADSYSLGKSGRDLLSITKKTKNNFGYPIFFANGKEFEYVLELDSLKAGADGSYSESLNVPLDAADITNPPYIAEIFTIFPHLLGGYDRNIDDDSANLDVINNKEFGIYKKIIFPHIF
jgi:hypothetical protein